MKRAPVVLAATATGLAATLGFTPHSRAPLATTTTSQPASSSSRTSASSSTSTSSSKTATGSAISTRYGPVQLKVTVAGGKVTKIEAVQLPSQDPKSVEISNFAVPQLQQSALSKQDGTVDAVSGATYTSDGYQSALQSALDNAGFQASASGSTAATG
jgi:uncharacterized protein with FMN-binding domain